MSYHQPLDLSIYGDGRDGDVVITSGVNLVRDMYYNSVSFDTTSLGGINPNGFKIFSKNFINLKFGKISRDGNSASADAGGAALAFGSLGGSPKGTDGATKAGGDGISALGGFGGDSGGGGAGRSTAGNGIHATPVSTSGGLYALTAFPQSLMSTYLNSNSLFQGGCSGAAGGGNSTQVSGGGGSGGGVIMLFSPIITQGLISAKGGDGGTVTSLDCGGGGGGGGGVIIVVTRDVDAFSSVSFTLSGGAGGLAQGGGVGANGFPGTAGNSFIIYDEELI